jgi:hypothetical protein
MGAGIVASGNIGTKAAPCLEFCAYLSWFRESRRADSNRLPLLQLRVITQVLQGCAEGCRHTIFS